MKENLQGVHIITAINKNISNIKWDCIIVNCSNKAINSHIYQQNGILNTVANNGHLMEVKPIDIYKWHDKKIHEITSFKKVGISQAFSYPTLCNYHDTVLFSSIEKHPIDLNDYKNQLLFFYRTILSAKRKEQIVLQRETRISQSNILNASPSHNPIVMLSKSNMEIINQLNLLRNKEIERIENDISTTQKTFTIKKLEYNLIKAYSMSVNLSPESNNFIYTNIFPYNGKSIVLIGSLTESIDKWTEKYFDTWSNLSDEEFELQLTTHLSKNSENFGLSPTIVSKLKNEDLNNFFKNKYRMVFDASFLLNLDYRTTYNFFANKNYGN